jgi:hypothetical protein
MRCCCTDREPSALPPPPNTKSATWPRRIAGLIQWAIPVTALALMPKCPMCVAAYVVLFTGIGLSLPVAAAMRWALIAVSIAALAYLLFRAARRILAAVRMSRAL